ncbi:hypothetical protein M3Y97_00675600 [Aphelenchoides bicaudatus]|nr:hypothetical protein M3Y97_00675600 [Aphelenchoides bicaudatus]
MPNGKTITTRKIDIHSPDGKLLSSTIQKTITYGKDAVLPPIDPYQNAKKEETLILEDKHECKHKCCHKQLHNDQMSEKTELVDLARECGDSTIYGDKWSNASGTLQLRRSRLLPNHCQHQFNQHENKLIEDLIWELNGQRRRNDVPLLKTRDSLMLEAQRQADRMTNERKIRLDDRMNVWIGRTPRAEKIVQEWCNEASSSSCDYTRMPYLKWLGVGLELLDKDPHRPLYLVVVVYE